jgi:hypothetical protein
VVSVVDVEAEVLEEVTVAVVATVVVKVRLHDWYYQTSDADGFIVGGGYQGRGGEICSY